MTRGGQWGKAKRYMLAGIGLIAANSLWFGVTDTTMGGTASFSGVYLAGMVGINTVFWCWYWLGERKTGRNPVSHTIPEGELLSKIAENIPCVLALYDLSFHVLYINRYTERVRKIKAEQFLGRKCYEVIGRNTVCLNCPVERAMQSRRVEQSIRYDTDSDGQTLVLHQWAVPILNENGEFACVMEINQDITQLTRLAEQRERDFLATITTLVNLIELKDPYTGGHSKNVTFWAGRLARRLGVPDQEVQDIVIAASLHDIGKIGIAETILNKSGSLTHAEYKLIRQHSEKGADALGNIPSLARVANIIRHHHEWFNGQGYPAGLAGKAIPLGARIIAIADAYDAMRSQRVYREPYSLEETVAILQQGKGQQFDPELVDVFLTCLQEKPGEHYEAQTSC